MKTARRPQMKTSLPGPKAAELIARDAKAMSPSFTRAYPFVLERDEGVTPSSAVATTRARSSRDVTLSRTTNASPR